MGFIVKQSWGGKENGFGLADCCKEHPEKVKKKFMSLLLEITCSQ